MKIYWTLSSIPELAALLKQERKSVWRACYAKSLRERKVWLSLLACGLCAGLGSIVGGYWDISVIGAGIGGGVGGFFFGQVAAHAALPHIRATLAEKNNTAQPAGPEQRR